MIPRRTSVAVLVAAALVAVATVLMAILGAVNYVSYRERSLGRLRRDVAAQADQLAVGLALPVWNIDRVQIERVLDALEPNRDIFAVQVQAAAKTHTRARDQGWRLAASDGAFPREGLLEEQRVITLSGGRIGSINLYATPRFVEQDLGAILRMIVGSILAVNVLLVLSVYLVLWRAVLEPLTNIERYALAVRSGEGGPVGAVARREGSAKELESLRSSIEAMVGLLESRYEAVRASEKKYRDIVDFSPIGIYQARPDGTLLTANRAFARMIGCGDVEEALALNITRDVYFDPEERARLIARYGGRGYGERVEVRLKRRDGTPFWEEMTARALKDETGQTLYFESFVQDVTARKTAEDAVRASEERYRLLFEGSPIPMLVYDLDSLELLAANQAAVEQYGYSREDPSGSTCPTSRFPTTSTSRSSWPRASTRARRWCTSGAAASAGRTGASSTST